VKLLRFLVIALVVLVALGLAARSYLLGREAVPEETSYVLDLDRVRALAASLPGPKPLRVNSVLVAEAALPRAAVFAGEPFEPHVNAHPSFQVVTASGFGLIDVAMSRAMHEEMGEGDYDAAAFSIVQDAMTRADWIVFTHEHADHIEGVASHPSPDAIRKRVRFTREQLENEKAMADVGLSPEEVAGFEPLVYEQLHALAPGVVLIRAAGHTPGSQMIFVALEDGSELLVVGDVAWHMDAIRELHYRPRLVTDFFLGEDRAAVLAQFRTLHELDARESVQLVVNHDRDQRAELLAAGTIGERFE